uniref:Uncharacterized protein n=1 Tax=Romanomermis culicivorax TaxID=13658 RepID=A0A915HSG6_ROMCU
MKITVNAICIGCFVTTVRAIVKPVADQRSIDATLAVTAKEFFFSAHGIQRPSPHAKTLAPPQADGVDVMLQVLSSDPSAQSASPSHSQLRGTQRPASQRNSLFNNKEKTYDNRFHLRRSDNHDDRRNTFVATVDAITFAVANFSRINTIFTVRAPHLTGCFARIGGTSVTSKIHFVLTAVAAIVLSVAHPPKWQTFGSIAKALGFVIKLSLSKTLRNFPFKRETSIVRYFLSDQYKFLPKKSTANPSGLPRAEICKS